MEDGTAAAFPAPRPAFCPFPLACGLFVNYDLRSFLPLEGPLATGTHSRRFKGSLYILTLFPPLPPRWIIKDYVCVWCLDRRLRMSWLLTSLMLFSCLYIRNNHEYLAHGILKPLSSQALLNPRLSPLPFHQAAFIEVNPVSSQP